MAAERLETEAVLERTPGRPALSVSPITKPWTTSTLSAQSSWHTDGPRIATQLLKTFPGLPFPIHAPHDADGAVNSAEGRRLLPRPEEKPEVVVEMRIEGE